METTILAAAQKDMPTTRRRTPPGTWKGGRRRAAAISIPIFLSTLILHSSCAIKIKSPASKQEGKENSKRKRPSPLDQKGGGNPFLFNTAQFVEQSSNDTKNTVGYFSYYSDMIYESYSTFYETILGQIQPVKDFWSGLSSGASIIWNAYFNGLEGLMFDFPRRGYMQDGVFGMVGGAIVGAAHFGVMSVGGAAFGVYQVVQGAGRTVLAMQSTNEGKVWSEEEKKWVYYSLDEDFEKHHNTDQSKPKRNLRKRVKDRKFYEMLGVDAEASSSEIKRAYYKQALNVHPDKNQENDDATSEFQELSTVYQTLISEETRQLYDSHGLCFNDYVVNDDAHVDPYLFVANLFGLSVVAPYIGDLSIASLIDNTLQLTDRAAPDIKITTPLDKNDQQKRRQLQIASHLRERIGAFDENNIPEFEASCKSEAMSLLGAMEDSQDRFRVMKLIGEALIQESDPHIESPWKRVFLAKAMEAVDMTKRFRAADSLERVLRKIVRNLDLPDTISRSGSTKDEESSGCKANRREFDVDDVIHKLCEPDVFDLIWKFNDQDILTTVQGAARRVIDDCGGDQVLTLRRAKALNILGGAFLAAVNFLKPLGKQQKYQYPDAIFMGQRAKAAMMDAVVKRTEDQDEDDRY